MVLAKKTKEQQMLEDLTRKMKAVLDSQMVLRDNLSDIKKMVKGMTKQMDQVEATTEVVKLTLRRKSNIEELELLEKKLYDLEEKLSAIY